MIFRVYLVLLCLTLLASLQACSPVKGYLGPERPETELSIVDSESGTGVTLSAVRLSGQELGYSGISVLPGKHEFTAQANLEGKVFNCRPYTEFDSYGFNDCEKERRKKNEYNDCDCFDYLSVHENCDQEIKEGNCKASLSTLAGERYLVSVAVEGGAPYLRAKALGSGREVSAGQCKKDGQRLTSVSRYVGIGRWEAERAGFYSCRSY